MRGLAARPARSSRPRRQPAPRRRARARAPAPPTAGPGLHRVAEQTVARRRQHLVASRWCGSATSPFFNDPFFQQFFGDPDDMFGARDRYASSLGSGVVVSADGYVVTNNHVARPGRASRSPSALADKRELRAKIVGVDTWTDLALLKVDATQPAGRFPGAIRRG